MTTVKSALRNLIAIKTQNIITDAKLDQVYGQFQQHLYGQDEATTIKQLESNRHLPEWLIKIVTINETFFFRHSEQFEFLKKHLKENPAPSKLDVLSLGCSSGEEVFSLAIMLEDMGINYKAIGVDLDDDAINIAKTGEYNKVSLSRVPRQYQTLLSRYCTLESDGHAEKITVGDNIRNKVTFYRDNVFTFPLAKYDLIFIRNILIYFSESDKAKILSRVQNALKPEGLLFIGAGELINAPLERLEILNTNILRKMAS